MQPLIDWQGARASLASARDTQTLVWGLLHIADDLAPRLLGSSLSHAAWRALGVKVVQRDLQSLSGYCEPKSRELLVIVRALDNARRQRFTVAHEIAHLLMGQVPCAAIGLMPKAEERLCDRFASRLLVPRGDLAAQLARRNGEPEDILALSERYGVSVSVTLAACGEWLKARRRLIVAASVRAHPKREEEIALRVFRFHSSPYLMPEDGRLSSLGLGELADAVEAGGGGTRSGHTSRLTLRLWRPEGTPRSGNAKGPAAWRALTVPSTLTLVQIDTSRLHQRWYRASRADTARSGLGRHKPDYGRAPRRHGETSVPRIAT